MAVCFSCSKSYDTGHLVSHAKNRVSHRRMANLHRSHVMVGDERKKVMLCTSCMHLMKKAQAAATAKK